MKAPSPFCKGDMVGSRRHLFTWTILTRTTAPASLASPARHTLLRLFRGQRQMYTAANEVIECVRGVTVWAIAGPTSVELSAATITSTDAKAVEPLLMPGLMATRKLIRAWVCSAAEFTSYRRDSSLRQGNTPSSPLLHFGELWAIAELWAT